METLETNKKVYHDRFGKGIVLADDNTTVIINFENAGVKKLLKKFLTLLSEHEYRTIAENPSIKYVPKTQDRHELRIVTQSTLISILKQEEDSMQKNFYFDIDDVVNSEIYTDGVDYYVNTKELIGDSWKLAMHFARTRY